MPLRHLIPPPRKAEKTPETPAVSRRTEFAIRLGTFLFNIAFRCIRHGEHMQSHFGDSFLVTAGRLTTGSC